MHTPESGRGDSLLAAFKHIGLCERTGASRPPPTRRRALRFQKRSTKQITMPNSRLPAEILDHIVDHLHDTRYTLRNCCLVSKSWIPRTRRHLFADIKFHLTEDLQLWKKAFPDPSTSPARYAKALLVRCPEAVAAADAEAGGWVTAFSRVVHLEVDSWLLESTGSAPFAPFHRLSPVVNSLSVVLYTLESPQIFNLILSFPLLEDLTMNIRYKAIIEDDDGPDWPLTSAQRSIPPMFTGSLKLSLMGGVKRVTHWLLSLPGGIHFRKFVRGWIYEEHLSFAMALVEECSHTLESLDINRTDPLIGTFIQCLRPQDNSVLPLGEPRLASIDLSKATKLKDVAFQSQGLGVTWITMALRTITPNHRHLQQISLYAPRLRSRHTEDPAYDWYGVGESLYEQWLELDRLLVQLLESHSIRLKVSCRASSGKEGEVAVSRMHNLFPEVTNRGIADFVKHEWR
jgi:hypothetical protein